MKKAPRILLNIAVDAALSLCFCPGLPVAVRFRKGKLP